VIDIDACRRMALGAPAAAADGDVGHEHSRDYRSRSAEHSVDDSGFRDGAKLRARSSPGEAARCVVGSRGRLVIPSHHAPRA
jgi:hypothetical protein